VEKTINYLVRLRAISYVAQTARIDRCGLKIFKQFYCDEDGNEFSDDEDV